MAQPRPEAYILVNVALLMLTGANIEPGCVVADAHGLKHTH